MYAKTVEIPLDEFPHVAAWFARITELDGRNEDRLVA
jgi:glutathione S-transferase